MSAENAPLLPGGSPTRRRRGGAALAAVALCLVAGGLALAVSAGTSRDTASTVLLTAPASAAADEAPASAGADEALPGFVVSDIPEGTLPADEATTKLIIQNAMNDVIPIIQAPEQIIDVELRPVDASSTSVRIVPTIRMGAPWKTCGQVGFLNGQDCLDGVGFEPPSLVASMNEAIENGGFKVRLASPPSRPRQK